MARGHEKSEREVPPPRPPRGGRLFFQDDHGRPCEGKDATLWCWAGATCWYRVAEHSVPLFKGEVRAADGRADPVVGAATPGVWQPLYLPLLPVLAPVSFLMHSGGT
jgi:hypothetical protein